MSADNAAVTGCKHIFQGNEVLLEKCTFLLKGAFFFFLVKIQVFCSVIHYLQCQPAWQSVRKSFEEYVNLCGIQGMILTCGWVAQQKVADPT